MFLYILDYKKSAPKNFNPKISQINPGRTPSLFLDLNEVGLEELPGWLGGLEELGSRGKLSCDPLSPRLPVS